MTITLKIYFAGENTKTITKDEKGNDVISPSKFGHAWFSLEGEKNSYGWGVGKTFRNKDNYLEGDFATYLGSQEHQIAEFSLTISLDQAQKLKEFATQVSKGKTVGSFGPNYNVFTNNCIHFVAQALIEADLLGKDFKVQNNHAPITQMPLIMQGIQDRHLAQGNHQYVENLRWYSQTKEGVQTTHKEITKILDTQAQTLTIHGPDGTQVTNLNEPITYDNRTAWGLLMDQLGLNITTSDIRLPDDPHLDWLQSWTWSKRGRSDPIILDLNGDGAKAMNQTVFFDHGGDGFAELTGWVDPGDGLLVRDLDKDGKITSGAELFGNYTLLKDGKHPWHGFQAMQDLDSNKDKVLDKQDVEWSELKIWKDANSNGKTEKGELLSLEEVGVQSIETQHRTYYHYDAYLNDYAYQAEWTDLNGKKHQVVDVWFVSTFWMTERDWPTAQFNFPDLKAWGNLGSLHQAATISPQIQPMVERYFSESGIPERAEIMEDIMREWGRAGAKDYDYSSMYSFLVDEARFVVRFFGEDHSQTHQLWYSQSNSVKYLFEQFRNFYMAQMDKQKLQKLAIRWNGTEFEVDASGLVAELKSIYQEDRKQGISEIALWGQSLKSIAGGEKALQAIKKEVSGTSEFDLLLKNISGAMIGTNKNNVLDIRAEDGGIAVSFDGSDVLRGNKGNDRLYAGDGESNLVGREGDDHLEGGAYRNFIRGDEGNDTILGHAGGDTIYGCEGDDLIKPGSDRGRDSMDGGWGSDTYILEKQWGQDSLFERTDWEGKDRLIFSQHKGEELWFSQGYFGLRINPVGNRQDILEITIPEGIEEIISKDGKVLKVEDARKLAQKMDVYQNHNFFVPEDVQVEVMGSNVELKALVIESWV